MKVFYKGNESIMSLGVNISDFPRFSTELTDSARIERAIASRGTDDYSGLTIYFPSGTYIIDSTISAQNISIVGDSTTVFKGTGSGYMFDLTYYGELTFAHTGGGYQWRNFSIEKCQFYGNGKMNGVKLTNGHNVVLRDCVFLDTLDYGLYINSGSKYLIDHVTFRGYTDDTTLNDTAVYVGGSDHNFNNVIVCNYTKAFYVAGANSIFNQCHHWLNHNDRIPNSIMFDVRAGGCIFTDSYVDTIKIGFNISTADCTTIKGVIGYNNPTFELTGGVYINNSVSSSKITAMCVSVVDTKSPTIWSGATTGCKIWDVTSISDQ